MSEVYQDISGVILAGGRSKRLGSSKCFLRVGGKRIIENTLRIFNSLFEEIFIVTYDKNLFSGLEDVKVAEDLIRGCGPLGGVYTGLKKISRDKGFFVACDMPNLHPGLIKRVLDFSKAEPYDAVVPYHRGKTEPLHAVYAKRILPKMEKALKERRFSLINLLAGCHCGYLFPTDVELSSFTNINTPEELAGVERVQ